MLLPLSQHVSRALSLDESKFQPAYFWKPAVLYRKGPKLFDVVYYRNVRLLLGGRIQEQNSGNIYFVIMAHVTI